MSIPNASERLRVRLNCVTSISSPARNISNNLPISAKKAATCGFFGATANTLGPNTTPAASKPTIDGSPNRWHNFGTNKNTASAIANRVIVESWVRDSKNTVSIMSFLC